MFPMRFLRLLHPTGRNGFNSWPKSATPLPQPLLRKEATNGAEHHRQEPDSAPTNRAEHYRPEPDSASELWTEHAAEPSELWAERAAESPEFCKQLRIYRIRWCLVWRWFAW